MKLLEVEQHALSGIRLEANLLNQELAKFKAKHQRLLNLIEERLNLPLNSIGLGPNSGYYIENDEVKTVSVKSAQETGETGATKEVKKSDKPRPKSDKS